MAMTDDDVTFCAAPRRIQVTGVGTPDFVKLQAVVL